MIKILGQMSKIYRLIKKWSSLRYILEEFIIVKKAIGDDGNSGRVIFI